MFSLGPASDQDVVQVDESEVQSPSGLVHQTLECLGRICEAHGESEELE